MADPLIGVKSGGGDDALHIVRRSADATTLCALAASDRNTAAYADDLIVDANDVCWECGRIARERARF